jgi:HEAT repeat protein
MLTRRWSVRYGIKGLLVLVLTCACVLWAFRTVWETSPSTRWARQLNSADAKERRLAASELRASHDQEDPALLATLLPALIEAARDEDAVVRRDVTGCLALIAQRKNNAPVQVREHDADLPTLIRVLAAAITDSDATVRAEAANGLAPLGPNFDAASRAVVEAMRDDDAAVREAVMHGLDYRSPATTAFLPNLVEATRDADPKVRSTAVRAFGQLPAKVGVVIPAILRAGKDSDSRVRQAAADALGTLTASNPNTGLKIDRHAALPFLLSSLKDARQPLRPAVAYALRVVADSDREAATAALLEAVRDADPVVRANAACALGRSAAPDHVPAISALLDALNDKEYPVCVAAAEALGAYALYDGRERSPLPTASCGRARLKKAVAALVGLVGDPATRARRSASVASSAHATWDASSVDARQAALFALERFGADAVDAVPALLKAVKENQSYRLHALYLLATTAAGTDQSKAVAAEFVGLLKSYDATIRSMAATSLRRLGAERAVAVPALDGALKDEDTQVRIAVAAALASLAPRTVDGEKAVAELVTIVREGKNVNFRCWAIGRLGQDCAWSETALRALDEALRESEPLVRVNAATALVTAAPGTDRQKSAVTELIASLQRDQPADTFMIVESLGRAGADAQEALPALEWVIQNDPAEWHRKSAASARDRITAALARRDVKKRSESVPDAP